MYLFELGVNYFTILHWFCHTSTGIHHRCRFFKKEKFKVKIKGIIIKNIRIV